MRKLNAQQQHAVDSTSKKILCLAGAGAGKTATMIERISRLVKEGVWPTSILVLTFTNAAGFEMKERYKAGHPNQIIPEFRTFHSFCYSLIVKDSTVRNVLGYSKIPTIVEEAEIKRLETEIKMQCGIKLTEAQLREEVQLTENQKYELTLYKKALRKMLKTENVITFNMLCYDVGNLFVQNHDCIKQYKDQYKYIFVDEFQDTDNKQVQFLNSFKDAHFYFCGDVLQCQPAGTQVMLPDTTTVNIEDLKVGDKVLSYDCKNGSYLQSQRKSHGDFKSSCSSIEAIEHHFADNIVEIRSANHCAKYTKDHITYAKMHYEGNEDKYVVYLMRNDKGWWRVGECRLYNNNGADFGPRHRMQEEQGSQVWILDICDNKADVWIKEQQIAYKYRIPQTTWQFSNVYRYNEESLQKLYDSLTTIESDARDCLHAYGQDILYPFVDVADSGKHYSKLHLFPLRVGNLIPEIMDIVVPELKQDDSKRLHNTYEKITSIVECEPEEVWSIEVANQHNYVSNGVLTHNCIYQFRGCSNETIKLLANDTTWEQIKLFENYRSTNQICEFANNMSTYADPVYRIEMHGQRDGDSVKVIHGSYTDWKHPIDKEHLDKLKELVQQLKGEDGAVLCRTNREVQCICDAFDEAGIKYCTGKRNDDAIHMLKASIDNEYMLDWLASFLTAEKYAEYIRLAAQEENPDINWFAKVYGKSPKINGRGKTIVAIRRILNDSTKGAISKCVDILAELGINDLLVGIDNSVDSKRDVVMHLIDLMDTAQSEELYVGTIHSSKGLEYSTVYVMGVGEPKTFPLDCEEMLNLYYVALTRAKNHLFVFRT